MKYIIMCGGEYTKWKKPRWLSEIDGNMMLDRLIAQLKFVACLFDDDIYVSSSNKDVLDVALGHGVNIIDTTYTNNNFVEYDYDDYLGYWCYGFVHVKEPVTYLFGDVIFSDEAIEKIVETETDDIEMFASSPPFSKYYCKEWAEPFALKVVNNEHLMEAVKKCIIYAKQGRFKRQPIMWELWQVIKGHELNCIDYSSYTAINDYTCDVDEPGDIDKIHEAIRRYEEDGK